MRTMSVAMLGAAVFGLGAAACTGKPAEAPVRSVASPTAGPVPYRASPTGTTPPVVTQAPSSAYGGAAGSSYTPYTPPPAAHAPEAAATSVSWYQNLADAQNEARASGKLILVGTTKSGCTLCEKFAHQVAPQCWSRLSEVAVPYMYDIQNYDTKVPDNVRVDRALRTNLRGAALMPLVGFLTPDLQWVHGFSGPRSVAEFMGDIESARRIYPVHAAALARPAPVAGPAVAMATPVPVVNEFGERDWSAPAELPAPEDALGPVAKLEVTAPAPDAPAAVAQPTPASPGPLAAGPAAATSAMIETAPAVEPMPAPTPEPTPAPPVVAAAAPPSGPTWSEPVAVPRNLAVSPSPLASVAAQPVAVPEAPISAPVAAPAPSASGPVTVLTPAHGTMSAADADAALRAAHASIRAGQLDEARAALRRVSQALPNTDAGREADRGAVAVYNARRIAAANADQRAAFVERAQKDLGASMWADLF